MIRFDGAIPLRSLRLSGALFLCLFCTRALAEGQLRVANTAHYRVHTDLEPQLADDLTQRMERMYQQYSLRLADFNPRQSAPFEVYLFRQRSDYATLTSDRYPTTGGIFIPRRNILAGFLEGQGRDALRRTLQHEAFHQFAFMAIGPEMPVWLNEGIAQVFEEGLWTGTQFRIGQVPPRRMRQLKQDLAQRRFMPFKDFIAITDEQWRNDLRDGVLGAARYDQAWAMTHFLIFAIGMDGQPLYRSRLTQMLKLVEAGQKPGDAFLKTFSDNFDGFESRFMEYARALRPTPEAVYVEYQGILADMIAQIGSRGQRFDDPDALRQYLTDGSVRLRYTKGDVQWSTETDPMAYFRDDKGRLMTHEQLYFSLRGGAPYPDIVCCPINGITLRTIFHDELGEKIDHETVIEAK